MLKKSTKVIVLVVLILIMATATAGAAIPNNSVIIGDKAFSIDYLMVPNNLAEINQALADAGLVPIYYQLDGMNEVFTDVFTNQPITPQNLQALPKITYKNSSGGIIVYAAGNGEPIATDDFEIISIE